MSRSALITHLSTSIGLGSNLLVAANRPSFTLYMMWPVIDAVVQC